MKIIHTFCRCINCNEILEITDQDVGWGQKDCEGCGYSNELNDIRLDCWDEEF